MVSNSVILLGFLLSSEILLSYEVTASDGALLDNYLPASMQALAYYIDLLQYEPAHKTTLAPPLAEGSIINPPTTSKPLTVSTTLTSVWWHPSSTTVKPPSSSRPETTSTSWWKPPQWWTTTTTKKPSFDTFFTTTTTVKPPTTPKHKPGVYAPPPPLPTRRYPLWNNNRKPGYYAIQPAETASALSPKSAVDFNYFDWFLQLKKKQINPDIDNNFNLLDPLPAGVLRDFLDEPVPAQQENDQLNEFLTRFDDNYRVAPSSRHNSITGKKRVPPTKPYVEFVLLYDLFKRDAKANNFSKFEGYSDELLNELNKLSKYPADMQLHAIFSRLIERNEITRTDIVSRVKIIIKDLEDRNSPTTKALIYFPPLQFLL